MPLTDVGPVGQDLASLDEAWAEVGEELSQLGGAPPDEVARVVRAGQPIVVETEEVGAQQGEHLDGTAAQDDQVDRGPESEKRGSGTRECASAATRRSEDVAPAALLLALRHAVSEVRRTSRPAPAGIAASSAT